MKFHFLIAAFLFTFSANAQPGKTDSVNYVTAIKAAEAFYMQFIYPPTGLYNGSEYADHSFEIKEGTPFFEPAVFNTGSILYDGVLYQDVKLLYNLIEGKVIIKDPFEIYKLALINERISGFTISDHHFIRLQNNDSANAVISTGFYEVLSNGETEVYKKEKKKIEEDISISEGVKKSVTTTNVYFIRKDNRFYTVESKGILLSVFKERKSDIQQFMRKNKLNFRKNKENTIVKVAAYYDEIKK